MRARCDFFGQSDASLGHRAVRAMSFDPTVPALEEKGEAAIVSSLRFRQTDAEALLPWRANSGIDPCRPSAERHDVIDQQLTFGCSGMAARTFLLSQGGNLYFTAHKTRVGRLAGLKHASLP
jgi:hypothetical protein